jgi:hypothetical protein
MCPGKNSIINVHPYKYVDTIYEMKYGYDLILDSPNAKNEKDSRKKLETKDKQ